MKTFFSENNYVVKIIYSYILIHQNPHRCQMDKIITILYLPHYSPSDLKKIIVRHDSQYMKVKFKKSFKKFGSVYIKMNRRYLLNLLSIYTYFCCQKYQFGFESHWFWILNYLKNVTFFDTLLDCQFAIICSFFLIRNIKKQITSKILNGVYISLFLKKKYLALIRIALVTFYELNDSIIVGYYRNMPIFLHTVSL